MAKSDKKTVAPPQGYLTVRCLVEGFRRGGRAWSVEPVTVAEAEFTPEQLAQIRAEPLLMVTAAEAEAEAEAS